MKKRIFVDTNVLLDVLLERDGFYYDALKIWAAAEEGKATDSEDANLSHDADLGQDSNSNQ